MSSLGPLVPPSAHRAGALLLAASIEFVAVMAVAQSRFPGYSDVANAISDLGNTATSPAYLVFDVGIVGFGLLGLAGAFYLRTALRARRTSKIGVGLLGVTFLGALAIGFVPENLHSSLHSLLSLVTFLAAGLSLLVLALAMLRDTRWERWRLYTLLSGAVDLVALAVLLSPLTNSGNFGAVERAVVAPGLLWAALTGIRLLRIPVYEPGSSAPSSPVPD